MMASCFFIGCRHASSSLYARLSETVEQLICHDHVTTFYVGQYGNFDRLVIRVLSDLKTAYPSVRIIVLLPYHPAERTVSLPENTDGSYYPFEVRPPRRFAIIRANEHMLRIVSHLVAYTPPHSTNAAALAEKAKRRGIHVLYVE